MLSDNQFYQDFKNEFIDSEKISINAETDFRSIESWDSLTGMAIMVMIQDKYTRQFTEKDFIECKNVGDVFERVKKLIG